MIRSDVIDRSLTLDLIEEMDKAVDQRVYSRMNIGEITELEMSMAWAEKAALNGIRARIVRTERLAERQRTRIITEGETNGTRSQAL